MTVYQVRTGTRTGTDHIADPATGRMPHRITGDTCRTVAEASPELAERLVTCSVCRRLMGWPAAPGSRRSRTTSGLDSSAWGANRGR
jgi:hypothetical protein